ncbi:MAG TPA: prepilin-type N-terminal cleavage/methylation domain-containing protein [Rugosimonospora sp.]|nr:prepilin-type N-terminal cleavage/methylation domain-containing protein [Rugosimonospora sp.]
MTRRRPGHDEGYSLVEVLVAMMVMGIFLAMLTTGLIQVFRVVNRNDAFSIVQAQVNVAFLKLDRDIRYASNVSTPGQTGADWYVEYLTTYTGTSICTELRLQASTGQLQRRTWTQGGTVSGGWSILATGLTPAAPFTYLAADSTYNYPRVQLNLVASAGTGATAATKQFNVTFTAMNTTSTSATVCTEGRTSP